MGASENEEYDARLRARSERAGSQPPSRPANARARTLRYTRYKFGGKTVVPTERGLPPRTCSNCIHTELPVARSVVLVSGSQSPFCFIACESCLSGVCVRVSAVSDDAPAPRLHLFRSQRRAANVSARVLSTVFFLNDFISSKFFLPPFPHHQDMIFSSIALFFGSRRISFKRLSNFFFIYLRAVIFEVLKKIFFLEQFNIFIMDNSFLQVASLVLPSSDGQSTRRRIAGRLLSRSSTGNAGNGTRGFMVSDRYVSTM